MRPTVDEQLDGVGHLIDVAAAESDLSPASTESLANARRLLKQIARSWAELLPFYEQDNETLTELLRQYETGTGENAPPDDVPVGVRAASDRNARLRDRLSTVIATLPTGADGAATRAELTAYLMHRIGADPS